MGYPTSIASFWGGSHRVVKVIRNPTPHPTPIPYHVYKCSWDNILYLSTKYKKINKKTTYCLRNHFPSLIRFINILFFWFLSMVKCMKLVNPQRQHLRNGEWEVLDCRKLLYLVERGSLLNEFFVLQIISPM